MYRICMRNYPVFGQARYYAGWHNEITPNLDRAEVRPLKCALVVRDCLNGLAISFWHKWELEEVSDDC